MSKDIARAMLIAMAEQVGPRFNPEDVETYWTDAQGNRIPDNHGRWLANILDLITEILGEAEVDEIVRGCLSSR